MQRFSLFQQTYSDGSTSLAMRTSVPLTLVKLTTRVGNLNRGEICGYSEDEARLLLAAGTAVQPDAELPPDPKTFTLRDEAPTPVRFVRGWTARELPYTCGPGDRVTLPRYLADQALQAHAAERDDGTPHVVGPVESPLRVSFRTSADKRAAQILNDILVGGSSQ